MTDCEQEEQIFVVVTNIVGNLWGHVHCVKADLQPTKRKSRRVVSINRLETSFHVSTVVICYRVKAFYLVYSLYWC